MSNLKMGEDCASGIELTTIRVKGSGNHNADTWWEYDVSEQFPIKSANETNGSVNIEVDKPHEGCLIRTTLKNSKMEGESCIYSKDNVLMAKLTFVDGIATGPCSIYNNGYLFFSGYFENGYREGRGREYDRNGNLISDGYYSKGKKLNIEPSKEMGKEYWNEYDDNGVLIRICQKDDFGKYNGICYTYKNGNLDQLSHWENGCESTYNGYFKLYDEVNKRWFKGNFENGYREGRGKEYDRNGNLISDGYYSKGKKLNIEPSKEMGKEYWNEYDDNGVLIRICQKDDFGKYNGICYSFNSEKISRVSLWKEGKEIELLKQFSDDIMTEYKNGNKVYEGGFLDSLELQYPRNGEGAAYGKDGKTRIFQGNYKFDKRHGRGSKFQNGLATKERKWTLGKRSPVFWCIEAFIIIYVLLMVIGYIVDVAIVVSLLILLVILIVIRWIHYKRSDNTKGKRHDLDFVSAMVYTWSLHRNGNNKLGKNERRQSYRKTLYGIHLILICVLGLLMVIRVIGTIVQNIYITPYTHLFQTAFVVESNKYNEVRHFQLNNKPYLKTIIIKNNCFAKARTFSINGLQSLTTLSIGSNSFTQHTNNYGNDIDKSKSFHILNCAKLESIEIGEYSFSDYGGQFELNGLPELQSLIIGSNSTNSYNFYSSSSFEIESIILIY